MSLLINNLKPKIADKDIICYKLVKRTKIKGVYKSSFQGFEYVIRQLYTNTSGNMVNNNKIFSNIVWKHIDEMKIDITKAIDILGEELNILFK